MATTFAVPDGRVAMAATTYTGNGSTQAVSNAVNSVGMQPDLVWIKGRNSSGAYHALLDSVRGGYLQLNSNLTGAEQSLSPYGVSSFSSSGFSVNDISNGANNVNGASGGTFSGTPPNYVGWQWKAGGTAVTNNAGTSASQVSANTTAGFSVVTYTGTGSSSTRGHGLGAVPSMIIVKRRDVADNWAVYHASLGNTIAMFLNLSQAQYANVVYWDNTSPTSTVFTVKSATEVNASGGSYVAYCWAPVAGYSAFGSYTGNGSADGPFIYTGFRPRFILVKRTDSTSDWRIWDTSRTPYNAMSSVIYPNGSDAEYTAATQDFDALSNGFKARNSSTSMNASGGTYIYAAFAENPLKYANAR